MFKENIINHIEHSEKFYDKKEKNGEMTRKYTKELKRIKELKKELEWYFSEF